MQKRVVVSSRPHQSAFPKGLPKKLGKFHFRKHRIDIHNEAAKRVSLRFNRQDHRDEEEVSVTALKSSSIDNVSRQIVEK